MYWRDGVVIGGFVAVGLGLAVSAGCSNDKQPTAAPSAPVAHSPAIDPAALVESGDTGHYQLLAGSSLHGPLLVSTVSGRVWELDAQSNSWTLIERPEGASSQSGGLAAVLALTEEKVREVRPAANTAP